MTIGLLPDEVLIEIFNFYLGQVRSQCHTNKAREDAWHVLVHVCQRWRYVVFESPKSLNLRLLYTPNRPVQKMLDVWPALPIAISWYIRNELLFVDNIIEALKQNNRVCKIDIGGISSLLLKALSATKEPFPALTVLKLLSTALVPSPALSDSFLIGYAPCLRHLRLVNIPFPALPKLLSSTRGLVRLRLDNIPSSGYIPPDEMVAALSTLTKLEELHIHFGQPQFSADQAGQHPPQLALVVLPALSSFYFMGHSKYLEGIVAQIDTPLLNEFMITFFVQLVLDTPRLRHFLSRWEAFNAFHQAVAVFYDYRVLVKLHPQEGVAQHKVRTLDITCSDSEQQLSFLGQVLSSSLPPLSVVECLDIRQSRRHWKDMENSRWLELLGPFTSVTSLVLYDELAERVAPALKEGAVLPALQNISIVGPQPSRSIQEAISQFITARELSGCPVTVQHQEKEGGL